MEVLEDRTLLAAYFIHQPPRLQLGNAPLSEFTGTSTDQVQIIWQTKPDTLITSQDSFRVDYRPSTTGPWTDAGVLGTIDTAVGGRINHYVDITGLEYNRDYEYRVEHLRDAAIHAVYQGEFRTRLSVGDQTPFSFVSYGDSADADTIENFRAVQDRINQINPSFAITTGDNAYSSGSHADLDARFAADLNPEASQWLADHVDYLTFGNHDIATDDGLPLEESIAVPIPIAGVNSPAAPDASERPEHNYSFDYGIVHFATFDTNSVDDASRLDAQLDWLESDLAASSATWKIVVGHHPVGGTPDKPETPADNYYKQVVPRLRAAGVDLLLTGHSHAYSWSYPLIGNDGDDATYILDTDRDYAKGAGLIQVVTGVGGRASLRRGDYNAFPFIASGYTLDTEIPVEFGITQVDVSPTQLAVSYVAADDGAIVDRFTITEIDLPLVSVSAREANISEVTGSQSEFTVTRRGDLASSLSVLYTVSGNARADEDYVAMSGSVVIPSGVASVTIPVVSLDDILVEGAETVIVTLSPDDQFQFGGGATSATIRLIDNERLQVDFGNVIDTQIHQSFPDTEYSEEDFYTIDSLDAGGEAQVLLRFDGLFGDSSAQIPLDSQIVSATLHVQAIDDGNSLSFYRMLQSWDETITWNGFVSGVQIDDLEARSVADASTPPVSEGALTIDVSTSVRQWLRDPSTNFGWLIRGGSRGVDLASSESNRGPRLSVVYEPAFAGGPGDASIQGVVWIDEDASGTIDVGESIVGDTMIFIDGNQSGMRDDGELFQFTDSDGTYSFEGLPSGQYFVAIDMEQGYELTFPVGSEFPGGTHVIDLAMNDRLSGIDFGLRTPRVNLIWLNPSDIDFGTALSVEQLNAVASEPGTFVYDPPLGTVLNVGQSISLRATFTPTDQERFSVTTATVAINVLASLDYGDAPPTFPVRLADDGARHFRSTLWLGIDVDLDADGSPTIAADGDGMDDDGVHSLSSLVSTTDRETVASFAIEASQAGLLDAWIDFNGDGHWNDLLERVASSMSLEAGANVLSLSIPRSSLAGSRAARFRVSSQGGLSAFGIATSGEVEDYIVNLEEGSGAPNAVVQSVGDVTEVMVAEGDISVRADATELFMAPFTALGSLAVNGRAGDETFIIDAASDYANLLGTLLLSGGSGTNTLALLGVDGSVDFTGSRFLAAQFNTVDMTGGSGVAVLLDLDSVSRLVPVSRELSVVAGSNNRIMVQDAIDWRMTAPRVLEGAFVLVASNLRDSGRILANVSEPWRNFLNAGDVNNDGSTTASDALRVINELDRREYSDRESSELLNPLSVSVWPGVYFDNTGDHRVTALDALRVINDLARQLLLESTGESVVIPAMQVIVSILGSKDLTDIPPREHPPVFSVQRALPRTVLALSTIARSSDRRDTNDRLGSASQIDVQALDQLALTSELSDLLELNDVSGRVHRSWYSVG